LGSPALYRLITLSHTWINSCHSVLNAWRPGSRCKDTGGSIMASIRSACAVFVNASSGGTIPNWSLHTMLICTILNSLSICSGHFFQSYLDSARHIVIFLHPTCCLLYTSSPFLHVYLLLLAQAAISFQSHAIACGVSKWMLAKWKGA
jgi:hypothetical protein